MDEELFRQAEEYNRLLNQGLSLSGESKSYFARGRIQALQKSLPTEPVRTILDFGCGIGDTTSLLAEAFPEATVIGVDNATEAIDFANSRFSSDRVHFVTNDRYGGEEAADLCYTNGVFHHIAPSDRAPALQFIHKALRPNGHFALFENNPFNPGTRLLMRRIPFDRNAHLITPGAGRKLVRDHGFDLLATQYLFFFPRMLRWLRWTESALKRVPMGAQYLVLGRRRQWKGNAHHA